MTIYTAIIICGVLALTLCTTGAEADALPADAPSGSAARQSCFMALRDLSHFSREEQAGAVVLTSPELEPPLPWDQLVVSWNAALPAAAFLRVEARALTEGRATKYYTLGLWSGDAEQHPRESVKDQDDADGGVDTDTLVLHHPAARVQLRITTSPGAEGAIRFIGLSFLDSRVRPAPLPPNRAAWGKVISAPERSQVSYPGGLGWCSPTCVSMDLAHWSQVLGRPELDKDVPDVARGVYDKAWGGTGNWPFNTAFAGSFPGIRAYVSRFSDVSELEDWIAAGIPVIVSVSYDLLKGKTEAKDAGHLILCVGFTEHGDIIVNDPWARLEQGETVRKTFSRQHLITAWQNSHNTVYLIYPETATLPPDRFGHWEG